MALETRGIQYVLSANTPGEAGVKRFQQEMKRAGDVADGTRTALLKFGQQGQLTGQQLQALSYQTTDIITSLASGQNALLVLLQQGGQLRDQFGGTGNVLRAFSQVLTVGRIAALGFAGGLGLVGLAAFQGYRESEQFRKSVALTGNAAGVTAGRINELTGNLSDLSGNSRGQAREALLSLAESGAFTGEAFTAAGRAALVMQRLTGESITDITKRFTSAREGVTRWAVENNRAYSYLTIAQFQYIRELEAQGRVQDALRVNFEALSQVMESRTAPALGVLERGWQAVKNAASGAWDAVKNVGRDTTLEERLAKINKQIGDGENSSNGYFKRFTLPGLREQQANLQEQLRLQQRGAEQAARDAQEGQKAIEEASKAHQDALAQIAQAGIGQRLAQQQAGFEAQLYLVDRSYQRFEISAEQYRSRTAAAERGKLDAEAASLRAQREVESKRVVESPRDVIARDAALLNIETKLQQVEAKRVQLNREIADFKRAAAPERFVIENPATQFRQLEAAQAGAVQDAFNRGPSEARRIAQDFERANAEIGAQLIKDEEERGRALIAIEVQQQRQRLQLAASTAEEFKAIEEGLASYTIARQAQLTEELKPEWQRRVDLYGDTTRLQKTQFNEAMDNLGRSGESAFIGLTRDARGAAKQLVQSFNDELARIGWQRFLAKPFYAVLEQMLKSVGLFGGGGGGLFGGGGGGANVGGGEQVGGGGFVIYHGGGIAGSGSVRRTVSPAMFARAPRYHAGGLAGDEVPAILRRGEEVLTRSDPRHRGNGGAAAGRMAGFTQNNYYSVPPGYSPASFAQALQQHTQALEQRMYENLTRPGRMLYEAR